jgi:hypothetical protein
MKGGPFGRIASQALIGSVRFEAAMSGTSRSVAFSPRFRQLLLPTPYETTELVARHIVVFRLRQGHFRGADSGDRSRRADFFSDH